MKKCVEIPTPAELEGIPCALPAGSINSTECGTHGQNVWVCVARLLAAVEALQEDLAADQAHFRECASGVLLETARREREALRAQVEALQTYHVVNNQGAR